MKSFFKNRNSTEYYITIEPSIKTYMFEYQFNSLLSNYCAQCAELNLDATTTIYFKFYLSDPANQSGFITDYCDNLNIMYYIVGQPPASGYKVALEAYHIKPENEKLVKNYNKKKLAFKHNNYTTHIGELTADTTTLNYNSYTQTTAIFKTFQEQLTNFNCTLLDNVQRVWFYIRDIDNNYKGFVDSRNDYFKSKGLSRNTHYIASTGIEGIYSTPSNLVLMNYKFTENIHPEQFYFMSATNSLCPAPKYNVAFERGTKIVYGDCSHYYISGTASIDKEGNILYENDVLKQIARVFHNIEDLLVSSNAKLADLKLLIIYLRDYSDYKAITSYIEDRFSDSLPYLILKAPVCRPGWLIETEAIAINNDCIESFSDFF